MAGAGRGDDAATGGADGPACERGSATTQWATGCATTPQVCVDGTWRPPSGGSDKGYPLRMETDHFAVYWPDGTSITQAQARTAVDVLESAWTGYMSSPLLFPEPYCDSQSKWKVAVSFENGSGALHGGGWGRDGEHYLGMWLYPEHITYAQGLAHELAHGLQSATDGLAFCAPETCGWIWESHANWMAHQLPSQRGEVHCSEMLMNAPHLYYGSTRDRYCNWQFWEFLKDKHCYKAVNELWTASSPADERDPFLILAKNMGWDVEQLNDLFGEWATHNISWDYRNPAPTDIVDQGAVYRAGYGAITDTSRPERRLRLTQLEPLDAHYAEHRRFQVPYFWAPQRWGYNVVRLYPDADASAVTVQFRGVVQQAANSGWRWALVATDTDVKTARYSPLQRGGDGSLRFCVDPNEPLWLVVVGAPEVIPRIVWDQPYASIYRYPYMVQLDGAWPAGFRGGTQEPCSSGRRHPNGGGCAPASLPSSVFVGPYAQVLSDSVSGDARIEDHATILGGTVTGGTIGALSIVTRFNVSDSARVETTFYPVGHFEDGQAVSGTAHLYGDVEYRGTGMTKATGSYSGIVEQNTSSMNIDDVTVPPPYSWRP